VLKRWRLFVAAAAAVAGCAAGSCARLWWRYAITVVVRQTKSYSTRAWDQVAMVAQHHRDYVPAYVRCLQAGNQGGDAAIHKLDDQLDESVILLFRRMAHAKYNAAKKKSAASEAAGKQQQQQQGWLGWLRGSAQRPAQAAPAGPAEGAPAAAEADSAMGPEEWNTLEQLVAQQAVSYGARFLYRLASGASAAAAAAAAAVSPQQLDCCSAASAPQRRPHSSHFRN
jgi:hypothetical protein